MIRTLVCIQAVLLDFYLLLHESHTKIKVSTAATDGETNAVFPFLTATTLYPIICFGVLARTIQACRTYTIQGTNKLVSMIIHLIIA